MQIKQKNPTSILKKISGSIQQSRKNIESDSNLIESLQGAKSAFGEIEQVIKNQTPALDGMKKFTKELANESSKNLQVKRFFNTLCDKMRVQFRSFLQVVKENFVISHKSKQKENWQKLQKQLQKNLNSLKEESSDNAEKIYQAIYKLIAAKDQFLLQFMRLMLYRKNILWRDLNAPYDDYIHGDIKAIINLIKSSDQKYGYTPNTMQFSLPKFEIESIQSSLPDIIRIILIDHRELVQGLMNYSKLSDQPQVIQDISKNQHIVKGLRERIEILTKSYENLLEKYRTLQISKGKVGGTEQKSLSDKLQDMQNLLIKKEQQILELKQNSLKQDTLMNNMKQNVKFLEDELSKWHKYQIPKIKEMEGNQKSIMEQFNKVRRDLETYSSMLQNERQEKIKTLQDLKTEKNRVSQLVNILGRERRKIKELKAEINRQQKIVMELVDKIPDN